MTLHDTVENFKKYGIGSMFVVAGIISLIITVRVGILIKDILFPLKADPANYIYGKLPALSFPENATTENLTYSLDTESGGFDEFPDRLNVYKMQVPEPNFTALDDAKIKARQLGFISDTGEVTPEIPLGNANYEWDEVYGLERKLIMNINTFDFNLTSNYLTSLTVLQAEGLPQGSEAIRVAREFLDSIKQLHEETLDISKTETNELKLPYYTTPQVLEIRNGELFPTTSFSNAHVVRVDFYHKDVEYKLDTGYRTTNLSLAQKEIKLPIVYPRPPYSTISLWVGVGPIGPTVVNAKYSYKNYIVEPETIPVDPTKTPTYSIKTPEVAFEELIAGNGFIASYTGAPGDTEVHIKKAYLAYYIGENPQDYLMPIYVFEGDKGFFGYVSAVLNEWIE